MNHDIHLTKDQIPQSIKIGAVYSGNKIRARVSDTVTIGSSAWEDGSRSCYVAINLETGAASPVRDDRAWPENMKPLGKVEIPRGAVVVQSITFRGKDLGIVIHVRADDSAGLLPAPVSADLDDLDLIVLACTCSYKSGYRKEYAARNGVSADRYETARENLIAAGYMTKRGAATISGKNAARDIRI